MRLSVANLAVALRRAHAPPALTIVSEAADAVGVEIATLSTLGPVTVDASEAVPERTV